jgi:glucan 1,3-beta-glucosidase
MAALSNTTAAAAVPTPASKSNTTIPFLRGVNIGNWLILEKWMEPDLFTGAAAAAVDQWTFDSTPNAAAALQQHWSTWFTASDAKTLASYGINALRIPIGYWAYDATDTPFIQGADHYLELAIQWARELNMKVWVDLHGSPGSQNGQDHSGRKGRVLWQQGDNLNRSTAVLVTMARKYGSAMYADVVVGLEVVNEPAFAGNNSFGVSQQWAADAYRAIKAVATNPHLVVVTHDSFQGPTAFAPVARALGPAAAAARDFAVDTHNYQLYTDADNALTQAEHIRKACAWAADLRAARASLPVYVGEWSALTNVCVHADGSSTAGTSCSASGCQCVSSADPKAWNVRTVEAVRRYVEAQLDVWEASTDGYFLWTFGGPGGWGLGNLVAAGAMPNPVTERKFPGQCG